MCGSTPVANLKTPAPFRASEISDEDIARLQSLENERLVITPNHPTNTDPAWLFALSRRAQIPFHYLSCREAFDGMSGYWAGLTSV